jgi:hypothetical protein
MHFQVRVPRGEFGQQGPDPAPAKFHWRADPQKASGCRAPRRHLGFGVSQSLEEAPAVFVIERALVGKAETPRAAIGKPHAKTRFQRRKTAADRGRRRAQRDSAGGNSPRLHDGAKKLDVADAVSQGPLPCFRQQEA